MSTHPKSVTGAHCKKQTPGGKQTPNSCKDEQEQQKKEDKHSHNSDGSKDNIGVKYKNNNYNQNGLLSYLDNKKEITVEQMNRSKQAPITPAQLLTTQNRMAQKIAKAKVKLRDREESWSLGQQFRFREKINKAMKAYEEINLDLKKLVETQKNFDKLLEEAQLTQISIQEEMYRRTGLSESEDEDRSVESLSSGKSPIPTDKKDESSVEDSLMGSHVEESSTWSFISQSSSVLGYDNPIYDNELAMLTPPRQQEQETLAQLSGMPTTIRKSPNPPEQSRENDAWKYDDFLPKQPREFRIMMQNCNGAFHGIASSNEHYAGSMRNFQQHDPDCVMLNETNTAWNKYDMGRTAEMTNKAIFPGATKTITSSTPVKGPIQGVYVSGGTLTVCTDRITSRIFSTGSEKYGRWTKVVIQAKGGKIALYNVYRPNPGSRERSGAATAWMRQWQLLHQHHDPCDPRRLVLEALEKDIVQGITRNIYPIVMGDFNEDLSIDKEERGLQFFMDSCDLNHIFLDKFGEIPSTRNNRRSVCHALIHSSIRHRVTRAGICEEDVGFIASDHRALFIDLAENMLDARPHVLIPKEHRILQLNNAHRVDQYLQEVERRISSEKIHKRLDALEKYLKEFSFDEVAEEIVEQLDEILTTSMIQAEEATAVKVKYDFSGALVYIIGKIRTLRLILRHIRTKRSIQIDRDRCEEFNIDLPENPTAIEVESLVQEARKELKQCQKDHTELREEHLEKLCEKAASMENKPLEQIIKLIKNREKQKQSWKKINWATKNNSYSQVDRLGIPRDYVNKSTEEIWEYLQSHPSDVQWRYISDPKEIERRIIEWNTLHFDQASGTPLGGETWDTALDPTKITNKQVMDQLDQAIRNHGENLHIHTKAFLKEIIQNTQPEMPSLLSQISCKNFRKFYKRTPENRSSSPSGLHLSHWKAIARKEVISEAWSRLLNICVQNAYTMKRWRNIVTILLEKDRGQPTIHRMRMIHLVESDFNFVLRLLWGRNFMKNNEKVGSFHPNQYGGRKGVQSQSAALNKRLTIDIVRHYKEDTVLIDKDATACYDRIIRYLVVYTLHRLGLPVSLMKFMNSFLMQAIYKVKTAAGISEGHYTCKHGTGQGLGWSPPNWASISDVISCLMDRYTPGMKVSDPASKEVSDRKLDAFIDDVNAGVTETGWKDFTANELVSMGETLFEQATNNMQAYSNFLESSGGELNLRKCYMYMLQFRWKGINWSMVKNKTKLKPAKIQQGPRAMEIKLLNPEESRKMLGVHMAPNNKQKGQTDALCKKAKIWGTNVKKNYLNVYDASLAYTNGLLPSVEYPIGVSSLSPNQCDKIMKEVNTPFLHKLGLNGKLDRNIMCGTFEIGGLNYRDLYTTGGISKYQMLIGHQRKNDETARLQRIAMACAQQWSGLSTPILQNNYEVYKMLVEESWFSSLWDFSTQIGASVLIEGAWTPPKTCANDKCIMEEAMALKLPSDVLKKFNVCRLYKKVYFIGDVVQFGSLTITEGNRVNNTRNFHEDKFPNIHLTPKILETWSSVLKDIVRRVPHRKDLGPIISHRSLEWVKQAGDSALYRKEGKDRFRTYTKKSYNRYERGTTIRSEIVVHIVCRVAHVDDRIVRIREEQEMQKQAPPQAPEFLTIDSQATRYMRFIKHLESYPGYIRDNWGSLSGMEDVELMVEDIKNRKTIGVGDASVKNQRAAHAYSLETGGRGMKIQGEAFIQMEPSESDSTRAERFAVLAMVTLVHAITTFFKMETGKVILYCDNDKSVEKLNIQYSSFSRLCRNDMDIRVEIEYWLKKIPISMELCEVDGHMDEEEGFEYESAPQEVQMNIDMDICAKKKLESMPSEFQLDTPYMEHSGPTLIIEDMPVVRDMDTKIRREVHDMKIRDKLTLDGIYLEQSQLIDWEGIRLLFTTVDISTRIKFMKIMHKQVPTYKKLAVMKMVENPACIRCGDPVEDFNHVYRCNGNGCEAERKQALHPFIKSLQKTKTSPLLQRFFLAILRADSKGVVPIMPRRFLSTTDQYEEAKTAFLSQEEIGWDMFKRGYVSKKWAAAQASYWEKFETGTQCSQKWMANLIKYVLTYSHGVWVARCNTLHKSDNGKETLTKVAAVREIRDLLSIPRRDLSLDEVKLHANVKRILTFASETTVVRWLRLLRTVREEEIKRRRKTSMALTGMRSLESYFDQN